MQGYKLSQNEMLWVMLSVAYIGICTFSTEIGHSSPCHVLFNVHVGELHQAMWSAYPKMLAVRCYGS